MPPSSLENLGTASARSCPHVCVCDQCSANLHTPGLAMADSGQPFEALALDSVTTASDNLFQAAEAMCSIHTVSVAKTPRMEVVMGGYINAKYRDRYIFTFATLKTMLAAYLCPRIYCSG